MSFAKVSSALLPSVTSTNVSSFGTHAIALLMTCTSGNRAFNSSATAEVLLGSVVISIPLPSSSSYSSTSSVPSISKLDSRTVSKSSLPGEMRINPLLVKRYDVGVTVALHLEMIVFVSWSVRSLLSVTHSLHQLSHQHLVGPNLPGYLRAWRNLHYQCHRTGSHTFHDQCFQSYACRRDALTTLHSTLYPLLRHSSYRLKIAVSSGEKFGKSS